MTKLGLFIIGVIAIVIVAFVSMTSFGGSAKVASPAQNASADRDRPGALVVPVADVPRSALSSNWGDPRGGGTRPHRGLDIMAPLGMPVVAAAPGTIEKMFDSKLGGTTLYLRSRDRRWTYYYAHLAGYAPGVREGQAVRAGETLGYVGDTGDAGRGNYHLHFSVSRMQPGERWHEGQDIDPYPLLAGSGAGG